MPEASITRLDRAGRFRYSRTSFFGAGIDTATPPVQNPDKFAVLSNVMPPSVEGFPVRRWGYELFNNPSLAARKMYEFQKDASITERRIVLTSTAAVKAINEDGSTYNTGILTPGTGADTPRMVSSRDYGYFADGLIADLKKWNGAATGGTSKWGIGLQSSTGPASPGTIAESGSGTSWTSPGNVATSNDARATVTLSGAPIASSKVLHSTNFGFAIGAGAVIEGIKVEVEYTASFNDGSISMRLLKAGVEAGDYRYLGAVAAEAYVAAGSDTDLWGVTLLPADINAATFGIALTASADTGTFSIDHIRITIYSRAGAIAVGATSAGTVTLVSGRKYSMVFKNSSTGHLSGLIPFSVSTGAITTDLIPLSSIPVSTDSQVDFKILLATADGGDETTLYELAELANATTTYNDDIPEITLLTRNLFLETDEFGDEYGVSDNDPPPNIKNPFKHKGRLWGVVGQYLYFTKSIAELTTSTGIIVGRYEEAWPPTFYTDISPGAETVRAAISDGDSIYVGTERSIRRIVGDGPNDIRPVEYAFNNVGVLNQETWQQVFTEGSPAGVIWMTPDFRLLWSDFNTYRDIGRGVQDTLDSINTTHATKSWAVYVGDGGYDLYILAIPTNANTEPDTLLVFDLRSREWVSWTPTDNLTSGLYNINADGIPQFLATASSGKVYKFGSAFDQDRESDTPVTFTMTATTAWLDFEEPWVRKLLNEMELLVDFGGSGFSVAISGASTKAEFDSPVTITFSSGLSTSSLGEFKLYLGSSSGTATALKDRFYRFSFSLASTSSAELMRAFSVTGVRSTDV